MEVVREHEDDLSAQAAALLVVLGYGREVTPGAGCLAGIFPPAGQGDVEGRIQDEHTQ
jgi:hypothetical protein